MLVRIVPDLHSGLPIGSLTSQVFANFYLSPLDHYIKHTLKFRYYGRYVDDMVLVHENRKALTSAVPLIRSFLAEHLRLQLHPRKTYLKPAGHGVSFLGTMIRQGRIEIGKRTRGNIAAAVDRENRLAEHHKPNQDECSHFLSSINSYLGILQHYSTYHLRSSLIGRLSAYWLRRYQADKNLCKLVKRNLSNPKTVK